MPRRLQFLMLGLAMVALAGLGWHYRAMLWQKSGQPMIAPFPPATERPTLLPKGERTLDSVVNTLGPVLATPWQELCAARGTAYPPGEVALIAFKEGMVLQVYARSHSARPWVHLRDYPVIAASGVPGPKLREGDYQVPEGIYGVDYLNPNSICHLSLKVGYPNAFESEHARREGRDFPGTNIMVHGGTISSGCLALGDPAIEEIFLLAAQAGTGQVKVIIAPRDFRKSPPGPPDLQRSTGDLLGNGIQVPPLPPWTADLYTQLHTALREFPSP